VSTSIKVSAEHEYTVVIGESWREEFLRTKAQYSRNLIFAPSEMKEKLSLNELLSEDDLVFYLPSGEEAKQISTLSSMWDAASAAGIRRSDAIWGIGGGATTDVAGFAAASWLRGVAWHAIPTTLAGMVDASIGGKTGINSPAGKNLIGAFHSPSSVIIDISFLDTLSERDFSAGLAEVIKTGFISDVEILKLLKNCTDLTHARSIAAELVSRSVQVKADVVSKDFKESKLREILNYGHTLGHAIEKREDFKLRHGEAISIGLVFAAELSSLVLGLSPSVVDEHRELLAKFGLPITYVALAWDELLEMMASDKKSRSQGIRFIGLADRGEPEWIESVSPDILRQAYERICS
jgi:3-dehydroquinate synthase